MGTLRGCSPIKDKQIDFQTEKICALPLCTLEVVLMANCDWDQANVIKDQV